MKTFQHTFVVSTKGRGMTMITDRVADVVLQSGIITGVCHVFLHHTSASLIICENADKDVQEDMETFMRDFIPDGDPRYKHIVEGPDDMTSHIRTILTQSSLTLPVTKMHLDLGTWQGLFLWEHRIHPHERKVTVTIQGD
ncbi:MAG TPA: secondary thiamine-phosphate synthase enzyme YjbQ [Gammaproteobacteria bacterium]|nr:secondary thiamine-phosphate synthase enzyme YjbQ [Gammaproteobacteria bacterium]